MIKIHQLRDFIANNHHVVMSYHDRYYRYTTCLAKTPYDRLRIMFLNSVEAAGSAVPLNDKYACYQYFSQKTESLKSNDRFSFKRFAECFIDDFDSPQKVQHLSQILVEDSQLPHFARKKANLFMKELLLVARDGIFDDAQEEQYLPYLSVPIDAVIRKVYWELQNLPEPYTRKYDDDIQQLARVLFPEKPVYLDDLWFWGHFTFKKNQLLHEANIAMLYTDKFLNEEMIEEYDLIGKLNTFIQIIHEVKVDGKHN